MIYVKNSDTVQGIFIPRSGNEHVTPDVPLQNKDFNITENGDYPIAPDSGYDGISGGTISVEVVGPGYDEGYQAGYSSGYTEGETAGQQEGYSSGYTEGEQAGYSSGYTEGETAGEATQKAKLASFTATTNGHYTREDGWNEVEVLVPQTTGGTAVLVPLTADTNTTYFPAEYQADGFNQVEVSVDTQPAYDEGYQQGYSDGEVAGEAAGEQIGYANGYADGEEAQKALLSEFTASTNGVYTSETGYSAVTVSVSGGGGTVRQFPALTAETQAYTIPEGQYGDWQLTYTSSTPTHKFTVYFPVASGACDINAIYQGNNGNPVTLYNTFLAREIATTIIDGNEYTGNPQTFTWNDSGEHNVTFKMKIVCGQLGFQGCDGLLELDLSDVDSYYISDVSYCHNLRKLYMPQAKMIYPSYAIETTSWDVNWDTFPLLESIGEMAFKDARCGNMWQAPPSLNYIDNHAFWNSTSSSSTISSVRLDNDRDITVKQYAFQNCDSLSDVSLVSAVYVGKCAFLDCTGLTNIDLCGWKNVYGRTDRYIDYRALSMTSLADIWASGPELPPTIIDEDNNGATTTNPLSNLPASGTLHLNGVSPYNSEWRSWASTYLPSGWTIDESN